MTHLAKIERTPQSLRASTVSLQLTFHLETGLHDVDWHGGTSLRGVSCAVKFSDGTQLTASDYPQHLCDAFGGIDQTEYMLNSLTYGWWQGGTLYHFNDPDHTVLYQEHGQQPTTEAEVHSRQTASAIAGTVHLDSDDLSDPAAQARAVQFLTNPRVNTLARSGRSFRPIESGIGDRAADSFGRTNADGTTYVAIFNYSKFETAIKHLDLSRLGLNTEGSYHVEDLWDGSISHAQGSLSVDLAPADCHLFCLTRA